MRSFARRSASHSGSAGGSPQRAGASVAPGSMRIERSAPSTYVAIDRTPSDSAARGMTFIGRATLDATASVHLDRGSRDHGGVIRGEEHGRVRDVLGLVESAERHRRLVPLEALVVDLLLAHER